MLHPSNIPHRTEHDNGPHSTIDANAFNASSGHKQHDLYACRITL
jgi:hypothetical protein